MHENDISKVILNASIEVHRTLGGPGLLESVYEEALAYLFTAPGIAVGDIRVVDHNVGRHERAANHDRVPRL